MEKLDSKTREQYTNIIIEALYSENINQFRSNFLDLHPSDQIDLFNSLSSDARQTAYTYLSPKEFAIIFGGMQYNNQKYYYAELNSSYSSDMLNNMFTDDIVYFLSNITNQEASSILLKMDVEQAKKVRVLLSYAEETAGSIMTKEFISISSNATAADVLEELRIIAPNAEYIYYLYVINELGTLVGVVSLRDLIVAQPDFLIEDIMSSNVVSVPEEMDQEDVGKLIKKYDFLAAPVVNKDQRLLGIVTVDDVMDILEAEATEDFGEISAARDATDIDLSAFTAAKKRSPWIIALMFFGMITASIIGFFEDTLESVVLLAVFIPLIMDSAGNTGTQSLAVAVRGLAVGTITRDDIGKMIKRELGIGALLGLICMILLATMITILYGNWMLAIVVGFSIFCTLSVSAAIGAIVPMITNKLKLDPAIASGPFITTVNDILGLLIYFSIATMLMDVI